MSEIMSTTKLHVDSRWKQPSESHSDFSIRLSQSLHFGEDVVAVVDNITIPNTFYSVNAGNDSLYIAEVLAATGAVRKVTLAHGNLSGVTYAAALANALNTASPAILGSSPYSAIYSLQTGKVLVTGPNTYPFCIMSDDQIQAHDNASPGGLVIDKNNPRSGNGILRNRSNGNSSPSTVDYTYAPNFTSQFLDLMPIHNIFIHSNLSNLTVMTPRGTSDCIACCPISSSFGQTVHHNSTTMADSVEVSRRSFETLTFQLRDSYGNLVETNGSSWSCSVLFIQK